MNGDDVYKRDIVLQLVKWTLLAMMSKNMKFTFSEYAYFLSLVYRVFGLKTYEPYIDHGLALCGLEDVPTLSEPYMDNLVKRAKNDGVHDIRMVILFRRIFAEAIDSRLVEIRELNWRVDTDVSIDDWGIWGEDVESIAFPKFLRSLDVLL